MKNHLQFNWWKYILIFLIPVILWCSVFSALKAPDPHQRVHILYIGSSLDAEGLQAQLADALPDLTQQQLKAVTVTVASPGELSYSTLEVRCFDYDILVFEESSMPKNVGQAVFVRLTDELIEQFPSAALYQEDVADAGVLTYGFQIDCTGHSPFAAHYSGRENCYLFVSPQSVNFDTLNENGRAGNDGALKAAQYLLEMTQ